jgi:hypothetical protein
MGCALGASPSALIGCKARAVPVAAGVPEASELASVPGPESGAPPAVVSARASASGPAPVPVPGAAYPVFKKTVLPLEQLAELVAASPELGRLGGDVALFDPGDNPYLRRSKVERADREGYTFTPQPVLWSPEPGAQVLVVTGRAKEGSFVAAWWPLGDGRYALASTFVMLGEIAPVALVYRQPERALWWTTCWQCKGETGHLDLRDDHSVVIVQD